MTYSETVPRHQIRDTRYVTNGHSNRQNDILRYGKPDSIQDEWPARFEIERGARGLCQNPKSPIIMIVILAHNPFLPENSQHKITKLI